MRFILTTREVAEDSGLPFAKHFSFDYGTLCSFEVPDDSEWIQYDLSGEVVV